MLKVYGGPQSVDSLNAQGSWAVCGAASSQPSQYAVEAKALGQCHVHCCTATLCLGCSSSFFWNVELQNTIIIFCFNLIKISSLWHTNCSPDKLTAALHAVVPITSLPLLKALMNGITQCVINKPHMHAKVGAEACAIWLGTCLCTDMHRHICSILNSVDRDCWQRYMINTSQRTVDRFLLFKQIMLAGS